MTETAKRFDSDVAYIVGCGSRAPLSDAARPGDAAHVEAIAAERDAEREIREAMETSLRETERERDTAIAARAESEAALGLLRAEWDALRRHYDAAAPERNLLALLDLYETRRDEALGECATAIANRSEAEAALGLLRKERDACREKAERLSEQMRAACAAIGPAWFVTAETTLAEAIALKTRALESDAAAAAAKDRETSDV